MSDSSTCASTSVPSVSVLCHSPRGKKRTSSGPPALHTHKYTNTPACSTSATIYPELLSQLEAGGEVIQSKLVDYLLNLALAMPDSPLANAIRTVLLSQPPAVRTGYADYVRASAYAPQDVAIETKVADAGSDPLVQLTIWAAASIEW